jgi:plastocyanin
MSTEQSAPCSLLPASPPPPGGHSTTISISNNRFTPTPDTISAGTITFQWATGAITHNVTWVTGPGTLPTGSGNRAAGDTAYHATLQAGDYTYHCTIHATLGMSGAIHVNP